MTTVRCPVCDRPFEFETSEAPPFCSARCRKIDLRRWLDEDYGLPIERAEDPESEGSEPPED